jgi:hypothetical protein
MLCLQQDYLDLGPKIENTLVTTIHNSHLQEKFQNIKAKLTSPGQTINRKLLSRFAISASGSGLTPLTCTVYWTISPH